MAEPVIDRIRASVSALLGKFEALPAAAAAQGIEGSVVLLHEKNAFSGVASIVAAVVAAATALGFASSAIFNWSYFASLSRPALHLLTLGDYTVTAILFIAPIAIFLIVLYLQFIIPLLVTYLVMRLSAKTRNTKRDRRKPPEAQATKASWRGWVAGFLSLALALFYMWLGFNNFIGFLAAHPWREPSLIFSVISLFYSIGFLGVAVFFVAIPLVEQIDRFVILLVLTTSMIVIVPCMLALGAGFSYVDAVKYITDEDPTVCNERELARLDSGCLIRTLERGVLYRTAEPGQERTLDDQILFTSYEAGETIGLDSAIDVPYYWVQHPLIRAGDEYLNISKIARFFGLDDAVEKEIEREQKDEKGGES